MKTGNNTNAVTIGELSKPYLVMKQESNRIRARIEERENKKKEASP